MATDFYEALGVPRTASKQDIQTAYRKLARQYHPDVNHEPGAEDRFKEISEAYSVLTDAETRAKYDRYGPAFRQVPEGYPGDDQAYGRRAQSSTGRTGGTRVRYSSDPRVGAVNFDDLFASMFGDRGGGPSFQGADQEVQLELSLEEAYRGGRKHIVLPTDPPREYDVTIPPGTTDGQRIRLRGEGGHGAGDGPRGDLYLVARISPHPKFRLYGRNIHTTVPIAPWEGALGATVPIQTPGSEVKLQIPEGTSSGQKLRLRGEGMPRQGKPGDLVAEVQIVVPKRPTRRERQLFEDLAAASSFDPRAES